MIGRSGRTPEFVVGSFLFGEATNNNKNKNDGVERNTLQGSLSPLTPDWTVTQQWNQLRAPGVMAGRFFLFAICVCGLHLWRLFSADTRPSLVNDTLRRLCPILFTAWRLPTSYFNKDLNSYLVFSLWQSRSQKLQRKSYCLILWTYHKSLNLILCNWT